MEGYTPLEGDKSLAALRAHLTSRGLPVDLGPKLRQVYIRTDQDDALATVFDEALYELLMTAKNGSRLEGRGIALLGHSGAGKSATVERLLRNHPVFAEGGVNQPGCRVLSVTCMGSCTLGVLGADLTKASGYDVKDGLRENKIWQLFRGRLEMLGILLVHVDEVNNLIENGNEAEHKRIINNFKALINNRNWPVLLLITGTTTIEPVLSSDRQLARRIDWRKLEKLRSPDDNATLTGHIEALCRLAGLEIPEAAATTIAPRLVHASCYQLGIAAQLTVKAVENAVTGRKFKLAMEHYAAAFARRTGCLADANPFVCDHWADTNPTIVLNTDEEGNKKDAGEQAARDGNRRRRR